MTFIHVHLLSKDWRTEYLNFNTLLHFEKSIKFEATRNSVGFSKIYCCNQLIHMGIVLMSVMHSSSYKWRGGVDKVSIKYNKQYENN